MENRHPGAGEDAGTGALLPGQGVEYDIPYDTSPFVKVSIEQGDLPPCSKPMSLVFAVMFLFLQNLRYTLIPTLVVPVALMGTFAVMLLPWASRSTC